MREVLTPKEIAELAYHYGLDIACFLESRNMWIVPPPIAERRGMTRLEVIEYKIVAEHVAYYNSHYPKFS